jgi:shikimate kinase
LVGFSGSGKSTLGVRLARRLKAKFYDTDTLIERQCGKTIPRIFREDGEAAFRRYERQVITQLVEQSRTRMVAALGGGAFQSRTVRRLVKKHGVTVYLSCSVKEIYRRMRDKSNRPLLQVSPGTGESHAQALLKRIKQLLDRRRAVYELADIRVSTSDKSVRQTLQELQRKLKLYYASRSR